jgi:murein L,D-transpeptidase YcbB/YkuD
MYRLLLFAFAFSFFFSACKEPEQPKDDLVSVPEEVNPHITKFLEEHLSKVDTAKPFVIGRDTLLTAAVVADFYRDKKYQPLWSNNGVFDYRFYVMFRLIRDARNYGLVPKDYHYKELDSLSKTIVDYGSGQTDAVKLAQVEMLTTDAYFVMAHHLNHGRVKIDDSLITRVWEPQKLRIRLDSMLSVAFGKNMLRQSLEAMEPKFEQYFLLKRELRKFIAEHKDQPWCAMPDLKKDSLAYMDSLKLRLVQMHFYDSTLQGNDSVKLSKALRRFQKHYRLTEDGKLGKEMIVALGYTVEKRIRQIEMAMERWRCEPRKNEKVYVWVNLPGFNLRVAEADTIVMESRIICGAPKHQTPLLKSQIQNILVYPYWNVPFKIAVKEILPRIKWDTSYLRKQHFDVLDGGNHVVDYHKINWKNYNEHHMPYKFRQGTGEDNSLGVMKFNFYNKYDVYIHDTNAKRLFGRSVRCLSHGCMRLEKYFDFATFLIRDDSVHIKPDTLLDYINRAEQKKFNLRKTPTLYVKYFSCEVVNDQLMFYPDIYGKDTMMEYLLYGNAISPVVIEPEKPTSEKKSTTKKDPVKKDSVKKDAPRPKPSKKKSRKKK